MATKKQIAEQAMRVLAGGHLKPDRNLDIREVMLALDQLRDKAVVLNVYENIKSGDYMVDGDFLSYHESVAVLSDTAKNLKYITLPGSPIALPHDLGIFSIAPMQNQEDAFIRVPAGGLAIYRNTLALENEVNTYYWNIADKVYFKNIDVNITSLLLIMAKSSKDITESADYPMPPNVESDVLKQLIELFSVTKQIEHDEVEDGIK